MKGLAWQHDGEANGLDRANDDRCGQLKRDDGRRGGDRVGDRAGGDTDRTEIVRLAVVGVTLGAVKIGDAERRREHPRRAFSRNDMNMAEGERQIYGERDQRKPRTMPDIVPNPAHPPPNTPFAAFEPRRNPSRGKLLLEEEIGHWLRRHCERSEAIQTISAETVWIASSLHSSQ